ncbi:MAG: hypothetical protein DUD27_09175 [Lachnospiraceae bacterium]|uniref:Uncharacterized protein n=1 Tax=Candidatus Weimeria bifida TaxID=2599074 RepID=A0A6N7IYM3_9FIRM|nr:hypothetical protein [Candidatus Weimeria bifida]RRF94689.1 MAG: hypothetical protein DUD27_09175 [Lachnospiraceae bacterium]
MSGYTVTNNLYLRNLYKSTDTSLTKKSARKETSTPKLIIADTAALQKSISTLYDVDYGDPDETDNKIEKADFYKKMKAFADTYNNTVDSSSSYSSNRDAKKAVNEMKSLREKYSDELDDLGVTFDDDGYMKLSESAFDNIDEADFEDMFGKGSDFMSSLNSIAKKLYRHIDVGV